MERLYNQFDVLARGSWGEGQVRTRRGPCTFDPPAEVLRQIEAIWHRETSRPGIHLFDGPMCRLERLESVGEELILWTSGVSYRQFVGTNLHNAAEAARFSPRALANPIGLSCALVSADGFVMMGRRSARVAYYPNRVHPFAGCMEPVGESDQGVFCEMRRELAEELSMSAAECGEMCCVGVARDLSILQPELIFVARAKLMRAEIESRLDMTEHRACVAIAVGGMDEAVREADEFTPVALATLALAGEVLRS